MQHISITEWIGYASSFIIMLSFSVKKMRSLRIINTIGCVCFIVYGIMLNWSIPIIITNMFVIVMNIYYLNKKNADT